jgi:hypothetical protein
MSEVLIASLQKRIEELTGEVASLKGESKDRRIKGKVLATELEQARAEAARLATERDGYKVKAESGPAEFLGKIAELEGKLTARDHRDAFARVREFAGPDGKKYQLREGVDVDALWQLTGYKAEGQAPDAQAISARLGEAAKAHPYLFEVAAPAPGGATRPHASPGREAGPGVGKPGSPTLTSSGGGQRSPRDGMVPGRI